MRCRKLDVGTQMTREKGWAQILGGCDKLKWDYLRGILEFFLLIVV